MWSLLPRRAQLSLIVFVTLVTAWGLEAGWNTYTDQPVWIVKFSALIATIIGGVLATIVGLVWRRLWRWIPSLGRSVFPDLNGRWEGTLVSTFIDADGKPIPPIPTKIWINQGLFETHVRMKTGESQSHSVRAHLERLGGGRFRVWYSYVNNPKAQVQHRSAPHDGVAYLECQSESLNRLEGRYYTARKTTGDMDFTLAA